MKNLKKACQGGDLGSGPNPQSQEITWLLDKLKTLYPHFRKTYGNQTWLDADLGWWTWCFHF